jgi:GntR family transcriptional regulator
MNRTLTKSRATPLHVQLYHDLRTKLQIGKFKPGDLIPAESELIHDFQVSRITVRTALDHLVQDGLIDRYPGRGSYVKALEPQTRNCLTSFTQQTLSQGRTPSTKLLQLRFVCTRDISMQLPFKANEQLVLIERLRKVDNIPAALVRSYLPKKLVPAISEKHFKERGQGQSILYVLEHHFGIVLDKGEEILTPVCVNQNDAKLLGIHQGAAVILKACTVQNLKGESVIYEEALWCAPQTQLVQRKPVVQHKTGVQHKNGVV